MRIQIAYLSIVFSVQILPSAAHIRFRVPSCFNSDIQVRKDQWVGRYLNELSGKYETIMEFWKAEGEAKYKSVLNFVKDEKFWEKASDVKQLTLGRTYTEGCPGQKFPPKGEIRHTRFTHSGPVWVFLGGVLAFHSEEASEEVQDKALNLDFELHCKNKNPCIFEAVWIGIRPNVEAQRHRDKMKLGPSDKVGMWQLYVFTAVYINDSQGTPKKKTHKANDKEKKNIGPKAENKNDPKEKSRKSKDGQHAPKSYTFSK